MGLIKHKTIEIEGAQVTVRSSDGWTDTDRVAVMRDLFRALGTLSADKTRYEVGSRLEQRIGVLATLIVHTESVAGDLGFVWPGEAASAAELVAVYNGIASLSSDAVDQWVQAVIDCDKTPGDEELAPEVDEENPT